MGFGDFKELPIRTAFRIVIRDKPFNFAENSKYVGYQHGLALMVYNFLYKKGATRTGTGINSIKILRTNK